MVEPVNAAHASTAKVQDAQTAHEQRRGGGRGHTPATVTAASRDHGPGNATLQRLQALADSSPRVAQLQRLQALADGAVEGLTQLKTPEEEELLQGRFLSAQRKTPEEEELLQGKFTPNQGDTSQLQAKASAPAPANAPNHTGMPDGLKSGIETLSGMAMDHVRVHYNSAKPAQLDAHAYARGSDIHLAPGQDRHLPHEAWHLVQQAQGRVQPTLQLQDGVPVNDDPGLEREADQMGERALASGA
jgi:hypothetical protein